MKKKNVQKRVLRISTYTKPFRKWCAKYSVPLLTGLPMRACFGSKIIELTWRRAANVGESKAANFDKLTSLIGFGKVFKRNNMNNKLKMIVWTPAKASAERWTSGHILWKKRNISSKCDGHLPLSASFQNSETGSTTHPCCRFFIIVVVSH